MSRHPPRRYNDLVMLNGRQTDKVSGIALAGGMSRRLGRNKAVEKIGGESLIERVVGRLSQVSSETIVVVAEESRAEVLDLPPWVRTAADIYPGSGSLGGIFTGLSAAKGDYGIVVACDMPFLNTELLGYMLDIAPDYDVVVPRLNGRPEPLHAIYSKTCLEPIERRLARKDLKIALFFEEVRVAYIEEDDIDSLDPHRLSFFNVNTRKTWTRPWPSRRKPSRTTRFVGARHARVTRMHAYHGRIFVIDLISGKSTFEPLSTEEQVSFIGGAGLGAWLLYKHCPPGVDPLSRDAPLIFARGPFLGAGVPGSSKMAVACKSPLTGFVGDSLSSGPVAEELSRMPFDALVIKGRASGPVFLHIEDESVKVLDAAPLVGLSAQETATKISSLLGESDSKVAAIGPAGEALVRFACISNGGRQAGRTGAGAVMGAKNLKAITFKGSAPQPKPDPELAELIARLEKAMQSGATAKYRGPGTVANLAKLNAAECCPRTTSGSTRSKALSR